MSIKVNIRKSLNAKQQYQRQYCFINKVKIKEQHKQYYKQYYLINKDKIDKKNKQYRLINKDNLNKQCRQYDNDLRLNILKRLGNKCIKCGITDFRVLQIDHINGGGVKEIKLYQRQSVYYKNLLKLSEYELKVKYQLLCANCNWIKRYENNEYRNIKINEC